MSDRAKSKRKRRDNFGVGASPLTDRTALPRPMRLLLEGAERFEEFLGVDRPVEETIRVLEDAVREAARSIVELAAPYDVFDVLASVHLTEVMHNSETYRETEHEGSAALIEIVGICLAARGHREGTLPLEDGVRPQPSSAVDRIRTAGRELMDIGSILAAVRSIEVAPDGLGMLGMGVLLRELFVRNLSYPHMEEDTLRDLFSDPDIDSDCRAAFGCGGSEVQAVFAAIMHVYHEAWNSRFEGMAEALNLAQGDMDRIQAVNPGGIDPADADPDVVERVRSLWDQMWDQPGDTAAHTDEEIADVAGLTPDVVAVVRSLASLEMTERDAGDDVVAFFGGTNPFRDHPLLRSADGSTIPIHSGLLTAGVRPMVERALKVGAKQDNGLWERYAKHRGQFTEDRAVSLLCSILPTATIHQSYEYFIPNPDAAHPEVEPKDYSRIVEGDALLLIDDIAIVVEAKSGSFSSASLRGRVDRLVADLRKIITSASEQGDRTRHRIENDHGLRLRDGTWLDLAYVREVHTLAVSLDDLSGIATVTAQLIEAHVLSSENLPWTVSLHDLRVLSEIIDRPADLVLYLRRRTDPELTVMFRAVDELDLFLYFLSGKLYVEPDPSRIEAELPQFGKERMSSHRRRKEQPITLVGSQTDVLDAWYFHQLGQRTAPAPKPTLRCDANVGALVDRLAQIQMPGWLAMSATLLSGDEATQRRWGRNALDCVRQSALDGRPHMMTVMGGTSAADSFVLVWASTGPSESLRATKSKLSRYLPAKKHQVQVARAFCLLFREGQEPIYSVYDNRVPGPDPDLDKQVAAAGLKPVEAAQSAARLGRSPSGRTTPRKRRSR